jgi:hypothetical protein
MTLTLTSLVIVFGVMTLVRYCIIPHVQGLIQRLIETALTKQTPVSYQNNLLMLNATEDESQLMLAEFEEKNV